MTFLEVLAQLKQARRSACHYRKQILGRTDLFRENRRMYFEARHLSSLVNNARYAESQLSVAGGEPLLPGWLDGLTSFEKIVFNRVYDKGMGFFSIAKDFGVTACDVKKSWHSALRKVLAAITPPSKAKLNITLNPRCKPAVPGKGDWYVVQVLTGREEEVAHYIRQELPDFLTGAIAATARVVTMSKDGFKESYETAIKGYIFVQAYSMTPEIYHWLKGRPGVIGVLSMKPLSRKEVKNLLRLCNIKPQARVKCSDRIRAFLEEKRAPVVEVITRGQRFFQFPLDLLRVKGGPKENRAGPAPPLIEGVVAFAIT
ncbi:MAG: hypothetical protein NUV48_07260 [Peptococcaceae bacterium]|jgi:transcription antitermination factor NusG|nr:hypothetical protein [Peptococcaceae bacterium]